VTRLAGFQKLGIRIIIGLTLVELLDAINGAIIWADTFTGYADFIALANSRDTPPERPFSLEDLAGANAIHQLTQGRQIDIPRFGDEMVEHFRKVQAVPSSYLPGGPAYRALGLNPISCLAWQDHHDAVLRSVSAHAESYHRSVWASSFLCFLKTLGRAHERGGCGRVTDCVLMGIPSGCSNGRHQQGRFPDPFRFGEERALYSGIGLLKGLWPQDKPLPWFPLR